MTPIKQDPVEAIVEVVSGPQNRLSGRSAMASPSGRWRPAFWAGRSAHVNRIGVDPGTFLTADSEPALDPVHAGRRDLVVQAVRRPFGDDAPLAQQANPAADGEARDESSRAREGDLVAHD